jgi:predicted AAA+ superfamily ATPase
MKELFPYSINKISRIKTSFLRYLYYDIDWKYPLIGITGERGVGKTTLMLQYLKLNHKEYNKVLYISLDSYYFQQYSLFSLAEEFSMYGGEKLFLDEVHRYPGWARELKNIYDNFPDLQVVFSGSSALEIFKAEADLSRRAAVYKLEELSLREYFILKEGIESESYKLEDLFKNHVEIAREFSEKTKPIAVFNKFLMGGYYPYFIESETKFSDRLLSAINVVIEIDLQSIENFSYSSLIKIKRVLALIAESVPFKPNISELSRKTGVSRDILLKMTDLLEKAGLLILLRESTVPTGYLTKPDKIYLKNTALFHVLAPIRKPEQGTLRETFFANQLRVKHKISLPSRGDFLIDEKWTIEIGGKNKSAEQIRGIDNSFLVKDNIEIGYDNTIPLWLFGFLY